MDNLSLTPKRLVLGGVVVGLAVTVVLLLRGSGRARESTDSRSASRSAKVEGLAHAASPSLMDERFPRSAPQRPPATEELIARILQEDKQLGRFMGYHKTVLLDVARREEYRQLLSSSEVMTAIAEALMEPGRGKVDLKEPYRRLMQIDYFEAALAWKDNPQRERVLQLTRDIITKDNFSGDQDRARRQMLGGTKMELYRLLYEQDARSAQDIVAQARGTRMESLVIWMAEEELRRRSREAEIQQEVEALQEKAN